MVRPYQLMLVSNRRSKCRVGNRTQVTNCQRADRFQKLGRPGGLVSDLGTPSLTLERSSG